MTKKKLLEIYNKIKNHGINISVIRQLRNYSDNDLDTIINSPYPGVMINVIINYEFKLLSIKEQREIINFINNAKNEEIAFGIYHVVASRITLSSCLITKIAKIISESNIETIPYLVDIALTNSFLINPNALEIMRIIGLSSKESQAKIASDIAKSIEVLLNKDVIEIIKIVSKIEEENKSKLVNAIAKNRNVLSSNLSVKLITLASKIDIDEKQVELITIIASDKLLEKNNRSVEYIVRMLEATDEITNIYNHAKTEIGLLKQQESKLKKDNTLFWNVYKETPEQAITLLIETVDENKEIFPYTRIRKKEQQ